MEKKKICCLCGKEFTEWGNDPWPCEPIYDLENDDPSCCDNCNMSKVIIARIMRMREAK